MRLRVRTQRKRRPEKSIPRRHWKCRKAFSRHFPKTVKVTVKGRSFSAPAWEADGNLYFGIRDIAYMLDGTQAQFDVEESRHNPGFYYLGWGRYSPTGTEMAGAGSEPVQAIIAREAGNVFGNIDIYSLYISHPVIGYTNLDYAYINGENYFNIFSFAGVAGFSASGNPADGSILISVLEMEEPEMSETGLRLARKFLLQYRSLYEEFSSLPQEPSVYWKNGSVAYRYRLYDMNNDGIPEILMEWVEQGTGDHWKELFAYADGEYTHIALLGQSSFAYPLWYSQGQIYSYYSMPMDANDILQTITFEDGAVKTNHVVNVSFNWGDSGEDDLYMDSPTTITFTADGASYTTTDDEFQAMVRDGTYSDPLSGFLELVRYIDSLKFMRTFPELPGIQLTED